MIDLDAGRRARGARRRPCASGAGRRSRRRIHDLDREHRFERGFLRGDGRAAAARDLHPRGVGRRGHGLREPRPRLRGARVRRHPPARHHVRPRRPQLDDPVVLGHRRAEEEVPRAAGEGREDRHLRPHRAERRLRRGRDPDDRGAQGRPLRPERREDVDQPRRRRRPLPGDRLDRPGEEEEARPLGHVAPSSSSAASRASPPSRIKEKWGILAGNTGGFSHAGRRGPGREPRRRGGRGLQGRDVRPRERPLHRRRRARPASSAPASTPRCATRRPARPSACRSASTSS